jgi:hypothetical protein
LPENSALFLQKVQKFCSANWKCWNDNTTAGFPVVSPCLIQLLRCSTFKHSCVTYIGKDCERQAWGVLSFFQNRAFLHSQIQLILEMEVAAQEVQDSISLLGPESV